MSIFVTAKDNPEKIRPVDSGAGRLADKCDGVQNTALRSVVASLALVARKVRPTLSFRVSKLQTVAGRATVNDLRECNSNKTLEYALETSAEGISIRQKWVHEMTQSFALSTTPLSETKR